MDVEEPCDVEVQDGRHVVLRPGELVWITPVEDGEIAHP